MFGAEQIEITSADLVKALVGLDGRPWAEMGKDRKPLTQNRLARMLKPLGIGPGRVGPEDGARPRLRPRQFKEAFERYLAPEGLRNRTAAQNAMKWALLTFPNRTATDDGCAVAKMQETQ